MDIGMSFDPLSAISNIFGSIMSYRGQQDANSANAEQADYNRRFQQKVLRNSIRWKAEDLEKAGFNRILATGMATGSASGAMAQFQNPAKAFEGIGQGMTNSARVAIEKKLATEQVKNIKEDTRKKMAERSLTWQLRDREKANAAIASANALYREMEKKVEQTPGVRHIVPWASTIMKRIGGSLISSALSHAGK